MTVRRNQPARNPREGVLQNLKKERYRKSKKEGKDQESIQSSTTPDGHVLGEHLDITWDQNEGNREQMQY